MTKPNWSVKEMLIGPAEDDGISLDDVISQACVKISECFVKTLKQKGVAITEGEGLDVLYFSNADAIVIRFRGKFILVNVSMEKLDSGLEPWVFLPVLNKEDSSDMERAFKKYRTGNSGNGIFEQKAQKEYMN